MLFVKTVKTVNGEKELYLLQFTFRGTNRTIKMLRGTNKVQICTYKTHIIAK